MFNRQPDRKTRNTLALIGLIVLTFFVGMYTAARLYSPKVLLAYEAGYDAGKLDQDWKALLSSDQALANQACHAWWFNMNHTDRKLDRKKK